MTFLDIGQICDIGNVRKENQDRTAVMHSGGTALCVIADGMGGMDSGSIASEAAVKGLTDLWACGVLEREPIDKCVYILYDRICLINKKLVDFSRHNDIKLGTTITVLFVRDDAAAVIYSGDTRLYHIRGSSVKQITEDETLYNYYKTYEADAENSVKNKSILYSYIGRDENTALNIKNQNLQKGDIIIMCSDGAYNYMDVFSEDFLSRAKRLDSQMLVNALANDIKKQRASDNFSLIAIKYK